jgi:hypothetical protein
MIWTLSKEHTDVERGLGIMIAHNLKSDKIFISLYTAFIHSNLEYFTPKNIRHHT